MYGISLLSNKVLIIVSIEKNEPTDAHPIAKKNIPIINAYFEGKCVFLTYLK